mmetsp:Transcript_21441/g.33128  ORF Transcript_21441/g.33128 Transcript_21441/m.33128 type:complete len:97 (+) Transcript_21441:208-498(+)
MLEQKEYQEKNLLEQTAELSNQQAIEKDRAHFTDNLKSQLRAKTDELHQVLNEMRTHERVYEEEKDRCTSEQIKFRRLDELRCTNDIDITKHDQDR